MVFRSNYRKEGTDEDVEVACKRLLAMDNHEAREEFLREAKTMMALRHHHVLSLIGVAFAADDTPILVMELLDGGCLQNYLRANCVSAAEKIRFGKEIASGMLYLHISHIIHRDLATRNCILRLKICDFGLSREYLDYSTAVYEFQTQRPLPFRWTAPEAYFDQVVSTASDVWSYGVTLWEIYSRADLPYKEVKSVEAHFEFLRCGGRLEKPVHCPEDLFDDVILKCWAYEPLSRPEFSELYVDLSRRFKESMYIAMGDTPVDPQHHERASC